jgi:hypothetical protein
MERGNVSLLPTAVHGYSGLTLILAPQDSSMESGNVIHLHILIQSVQISAVKHPRAQMNIVYTVGSW